MKDQITIQQENIFYNAKVEYTDPDTKKKFIGDVLRKDGTNYKVCLGKHYKFQKYILAKAKDLKKIN